MLLTAGRNDETCSSSRRHANECAFAATGNAADKSSQASPSSRLARGGLPLALPFGFDDAGHDGVGRTPHRTLMSFS